MAANAVLLAGASGLIGGLATPRLVLRAERHDWQIVAPTRRSLSLQHPRLLPLVGDPAAPGSQAAIKRALGGKHGTTLSFVCALGTTIRVAGSQDAFAAVDRDLVLALAGIAQRQGARQAIVVSSVGASARSSNFYLRVKGEMEAGIEALGFERIDILQPGLLLGDRSGQHRPGERIGQWLAPLYNPLLRGPLSRYRAIGAEVVAAALVALVGRSDGGVTRYLNADIDVVAAGNC